MSKRSIWTAALLVGAILGLYLWYEGAMRPAQVIVLPGGTVCRFAGTTYGTNHVMGNSLARFAKRLPEPVGNLARILLGGRMMHTTSEPSLGVWFELSGTNASEFAGASVRAFLADGNGVVAGNNAYCNYLSSDARHQWGDFQFRVFPRRSRELQCVFFEFSSNGDHREIGRVRFPNPMFGNFPQWEPEPLPAVRMAGDLEVTLAGFATGCSTGSRYESDGKGDYILRACAAKPGDEPEAAFQLKFKSPRGTNEHWTMNNAEITDATGNHPGTSQFGRSEGVSHGKFTISPALWPDEAAWRLKVELKRRSGFVPGELVSFTNVPLPAVGETNRLALTNTSAGMPVTLAWIIRRPDMGHDSYNRDNASVICIQHPTLSKDRVMDFIRLSTDAGKKVEPLSFSWSSTGFEVFVKAFPTNTTTVNIEFTLQQTRTVEFLAKPELAKKEAAGDSDRWSMFGDRRLP